MFWRLLPHNSDYFVELSIDDVQAPDEEPPYSNKIHTNFYLEKEKVDKVIDRTKILLRQNEDYQKLLTNIGGSVNAGNVQQ